MIQSNLGEGQMATQIPIFYAVVEEVHSGDDLILMVDLGIDGLHKRVRVRLRGVDTPSAYRAKPETEAGQIREYVRDLVQGMPVKIEVHNQGKGSWVVTLHICSREEREDLAATKTNLNELLINKGYVYTSTQQEPTHVAYRTDK
jgi:endonuclease YncB( thermonuclease family)